MSLEADIKETLISNGIIDRSSDITTVVDLILVDVQNFINNTKSHSLGEIPIDEIDVHKFSGILIENLRS